MPAFAETGSRTYSYDGYDIEYFILDEWDNGQSVEVKVTNTGNNSILNWAFKYDAEGVISDLWNAEVYSNQGEYYTIKNSGWNYEIAPGQTANFGYTLFGDDLAAPEKFELCSKRVEIVSGYETSFNVVDQWDTGMKAELSVTNTSDEPIEAWELSFDTNFTIVNLWDGRILDSTDNHYTIASEMWTNPIYSGDTKVIGFTAAINSTLVPEITNIGLTSVVIGKISDMPEISDEPYEHIILCFGEYIKDENTIAIYWDSNDEGVVSLYESEAGDEWTKITDVFDEYTYKYIIAEDFQTKQIKVVQTTNDGTIESEPFTVTFSDGEYICTLPDDDKDGLFNIIEKIYGTDPKNPDTDSDGLTDYEEACITGTNPLKYDTDDNGIIDADDDSDNDGLSNKEEIIFGTSPINIDTDYDGLSDFDEVIIYGSDPLNQDSDNDGINDGDEIEIGFSPLKPDSDENGINDIDEVIEQTISYNGTGNELIIPSATVVGAGNIKRKITIRNISDNPVIEAIPGITGEIYDFYHEETLRLKSAVISFTLSETLLEKIDINRLQIAYFNTENGDVEFLDTYVSGNKICANTDHFSFFFLIGLDDFVSYIEEDLTSSFEENVIFNEKYQTSWSIYNNHTYAYIDDLTVGGLDWGFANEFAEQQGGHLVTITSDDEQKFVTELVAGKGTKSTYWIGLTRNNINNHWEWVNGEEFNYSHWGDGEPSSYAEKWVHMVNTDAAPYPIGSWNDTLYDCKAGGDWFGNSNCGLIIEWDVPIDFSDTDGTTIRLSNFKKVKLNKDPKLGDRNIDTDLDGFCDLDELICPTIKTVGGIPVEVWLFSSDPTLNDSDGDGYADGPIDCLNNGRYNDPDKLISNVFIYKLSRSNNFLEIDGQYYGGNQSWVNSSSPLLSSGGCGIAAACDLSLYLELTDKRFNKLTGISNINNITRNDYESYFEYMGNNVFQPIDLKKEYIKILTKSYLFSPTVTLVNWRKWAANYFALYLLSDGTYTWGILPWQYCEDMNKYNTKLKISASYAPIDCKSVVSSISKSLNDNIPVTQCYGLGGNCRFYNSMYDENPVYDLVVGGHFVTITELWIDDVCGKTSVRIASWNDDYWVDLDEFINKGGILSTLIYYEVI